MNTIALNRQKKSQKIVLTVLPRKYDFLMELLQSFDFVQVEKEYDGDSHEEIMANLKQAARDFRLIKKGTLEGRPVQDLLNEL